MGNGFYKTLFLIILVFFLHFACCGLCFEIGRSKATCINDSKVVGRFLKSNIFYKLGIPKAMISDEDTYFCNQTVESLM
jgi:hypothetical protein